jgi:hypothetical protein
MKKVKFDSIRKIQNNKNKQYFKTYLEKLFYDQCVGIKNELIITEYTFYSLLQVSHYISKKILTILVPPKRQTSLIHLTHSTTEH